MQMDEESMLGRLEEHHRQIEAGLDVIRRHCAAPAPNITELAMARTRLSEASMARSAFVSDEVVPFLLKDADTDLRTELSELLVAFTAKRSVSNLHLAKWTSAAIEADWPGYCAAARDIWAMMERQMERERRVLMSRLRQSAPVALGGKKRAGVSRPGGGGWLEEGA